MKLYASMLLMLTASLYTLAQNPNTLAQRNLRFRTIGKDSVNLSLNEDRDLIEDSCAFVIRHGHFDLKRRIFTGCL